MKDDLISRQSAIEEVEMLLEQSEDDEHDKTWNNAIRGAINAVKRHVPSAQPDIIRCKDCVHNFEGLFRCDRVTFYNEKDDFCSKAKMKKRGEQDETD